MLSHGLLFEIEFGGQLYFYFNTLKVHLLHLITAKVSKNSKFMILLDFYLSNMLVGDLNFISNFLVRYLFFYSSGTSVT